MTNSTLTRTLARTLARDRALARLAADPEAWLSNALTTVCGGNAALLQALYDERTDQQMADEGFTDAAAYLAADLPALGLPEMLISESVAVPVQSTNAWSAVRAELSDAENDTLTVRLTGTGEANRRLQRLREDARDGFPVARTDILAAMQAANVITAERAAELG